MRFVLSLFLALFLVGATLSVAVSDDLKTVFEQAEQGNAEYQVMVGTMYYFGSAVAKDHKTAFAWYKKSAEQAAKQGDMEASVDAEEDYKMLKEKLNKQ